MPAPQEPQLRSGSSHQRTSQPRPWGSSHSQMMSTGMKNGRLDLRGFPGQVSGSILERLVTSVQNLTDGFGTSAGHYLGFTAPIFEGGLPETSADSILPESSLFLVDVDPSSPSTGAVSPSIGGTKPSRVTIYRLILSRYGWWKAPCFALRRATPLE